MKLQACEMCRPVRELLSEKLGLQHTGERTSTPAKTANFTVLHFCETKYEAGGDA